MAFKEYQRHYYVPRTRAELISRLMGMNPEWKVSRLRAMSKSQLTAIWFKEVRDRRGGKMPEKDEEKFTAVEYGASVFDPNYKVAKLNEGEIVLPDGDATIVAVGSQGYHAGPPQALHSMVVEKYGPKCVFLVYTLYPKNEKLLVFYPKGEMVVGFKPPETWRKNGKRWRPRWL